MSNEFKPEIIVHNGEGLTLTVRPDEKVFSGSKDDVDYEFKFKDLDIDGNSEIKWKNGEIGRKEISDDLFHRTKSPKINFPIDGTREWNGLVEYTIDTKSELKPTNTIEISRNSIFTDIVKKIVGGDSSCDISDISNIGYGEWVFIRVVTNIESLTYASAPVRVRTEVEKLVEILEPLQSEQSWKGSVRVRYKGPIESSNTSKLKFTMTWDSGSGEYEVLAPLTNDKQDHFLSLNIPESQYRKAKPITIKVDLILNEKVFKTDSVDVVSFGYRISTVYELVKLLNSGVACSEINTNELTSLDYFWSMLNDSIRTNPDTTFDDLSDWNLSNVTSAKYAFGYSNDGEITDNGCNNYLTTKGFSDPEETVVETITSLLDGNLTTIKGYYNKAKTLTSNIPCPKTEHVLDISYAFSGLGNLNGASVTFEEDFKTKLSKLEKCTDFSFAFSSTNMDSSSRLGGNVFDDINLKSCENLYCMFFNSKGSKFILYNGVNGTTKSNINASGMYEQATFYVDTPGTGGPISVKSAESLFYKSTANFRNGGYLELDLSSSTDCSYAFAFTNVLDNYRYQLSFRRARKLNYTFFGCKTPMKESLFETTYKIPSVEYMEGFMAYTKLAGNINLENIVSSNILKSLKLCFASVHGDTSPTNGDCSFTTSSSVTYGYSISFNLNNFPALSDMSYAFARLPVYKTQYKNPSKAADVDYERTTYNCTLDDATYNYTFDARFRDYTLSESGNNLLMNNKNMCGPAWGKFIFNKLEEIVISKQNKLLLPIMGFSMKGYFTKFPRITLSGQIGTTYEYDLTGMFAGLTAQEAGTFSLPSVANGCKVKSMDLFFAQPCGDGTSNMNAEGELRRNKIPSNIHNFIQTINNYNSIPCSYVATFAFGRSYTTFTPNTTKEYSDLRYMFVGYYLESESSSGVNTTFLDKVTDISYMFAMSILYPYPAHYHYNTMPIVYVDKVTTFDYLFFGYSRGIMNGQNSYTCFVGTIVFATIVRRNGRTDNVSYKGYYEQAWITKVTYSDETMTSANTGPWGNLTNVDMTRFAKNAVFSMSDYYGVIYWDGDFYLGFPSDGATYNEAFLGIKFLDLPAASPTNVMLNGFYCNLSGIPDNKLRNVCDNTIKNGKHWPKNVTFNPSDGYVSFSFDGTPFTVNIGSEFADTARRLGYIT